MQSPIVNIPSTKMNIMGRPKTAPLGKHREFAARYKKSLNESGVSGSYAKIGKVFGVSATTISNLINGEKLPSMELAKKISLKTRTPLDWLMNGLADCHNIDTIGHPNVTFQDRNLRRIPLISFVRAGTWDELMDPYAVEDAEEWIDWPFEAGERAYVLRIEGVSMFNPRTGEGYPDKSQVKFEPDIEAKHGDDVVVRTPDGSVTFKTLQITNDGMYLAAINPDWPEPIIKIPKDSVICGVADGHFTPRRRR